MIERHKDSKTEIKRERARGERGLVEREGSWREREREREREMEVEGLV